MKPLIALLFIFVSSALIASDFKSCVYGLEGQCPKGTFCINFEENKAVCYPQGGRSKVIGFPFKKGVSVTCDQGHLSPSGNSHTWLNTAFALDLQTKVKSELIAVMNGEIIAFDQCKSENDQCGLGFGNQVKILGDDGTMAFYAHLSQVKVKTGERVKTGDVIGLEGMSGWTGEGNPHLHFSMHDDWQSAGKEFWMKEGYLPPSMPFRFRACRGKCGEDCKPEDIDSQSIKCKRTSSKADVFCH